MLEMERLQKQSGIIGSSLGIRQVLEMSDSGIVFLEGDYGFANAP